MSRMNPVWHVNQCRGRSELYRTVLSPFGQKTHLTAFSCGLLMIITQEPAQSLAALDAPLTIEVPVPRK
jgi:hypothetical protein